MKAIYLIIALLFGIEAWGQNQFTVTYNFDTDMNGVVTGTGVEATSPAVAGGTKLTVNGLVNDNGTGALKAQVNSNNATNFTYTFLRCDIKPTEGYRIRVTNIKVTQRSSKAGEAGKSQTYLYRIGCALNGATPINGDGLQSTENTLLYATYTETGFSPGADFATASGSSYVSAYVTPRGAATSNDDFDWYVDKVEMTGTAFKVLELPSFIIDYNFTSGSKQAEITGTSKLTASAITANAVAEATTANGMYWVKISNNANSIGFTKMGLQMDIIPQSGYDIVIKDYQITHAGSGEAALSRVSRMAIYHDISRSGSGIEVGREDFTNYTGRNVFGDNAAPTAFKTTQIADDFVFGNRNYFTFSVNRTGNPPLEEYWTVDKLTINGWIVTAGRGQLLNAIAKGQQLLLNAKPGTAVGFYDETVLNGFTQRLIDAADSLKEATTLPQSIIDLTASIQQLVSDFPAMANSGDVSVTINTKQGNALNDGFAGFNMRIADSPWTYNNPGFVSATKSMSPGFLRYFSGTSGDYFDMNTGMYELQYFEDVADSPGSGGGEDGTNDGYTAVPELYKWVEGKGPHSMFDFNTLSGELASKTVVTWSGFFGSPKEAGNFARFCKNNNIIVDCWQFCNEPNFFAAPRRYFWNDGEDYTYKMKEIADSILAVLPDANLAMSYGWGFGSSDFASQIKKYQDKNGRYWNQVSVHAYPTHRTSDVTFNDGFLTANNALDANTNNSYFNSMVKDSWTNANLMITEFGVWNTPLNNTDYAAIYVAEYFMRMSQQPQARMIGKHHIASCFAPLNNNKTEIFAAYDNQTSVNPAILNTDYRITTEGFGHLVVNKAFKNSTFVYASTNSSKETVSKRSGGTIPAIYTTAYKGAGDRDYLLVSNKTGFFQKMAIVIDGDTLHKPVWIEYFSNTNPAAPVDTVVNEVVQSDSLTIKPYSVMRVEWLKERAALPVPLAPRLYKVQINSASVALNWWKRPGAEKYTVKIGTASGNYSRTEEATTNSTEITGLTPGVVYYFMVQAVNSKGPSAPSNEVSARTQAPDRPTINFVYADNQRITIHWASVPFTNGYTVKYGTSPGNYTQTVDAGNVSGYVLRKLKNNQPYYITVVAYNGAGQSIPSPEATATPVGQRPWVPYLVNAKENTNGSVTISWTPSDSANHAKYNVYHCATPWDESSYELIAENIDTTTYTETISRNAGYNYYRVKAVNDVGMSMFYSSTATVKKAKSGIVAVNHISESDRSVYPNPARNSFTISGFDNKPIRYTLFNASGKQLSSGLNRHVDVSSFEPGILIVRIEADGKQWFTKVVVGM